MFTKSVSLAALSGLLLTVAAFGADKPAQPSCCATKTRCCTKVKFCCDQPDKAKCCKTGTACCDMEGCCGPKKAKKAAACPVTGMDHSKCCASKASPMPPCCQKACDKPTHVG